jgi:tetratricopeptide (TPR) repeat protein
MYEQSLAIDREIGSEEYAASSLGNLAMTYYYEGDFVRARELYQEALVTQRKIGDRYNAANTLNSIGSVLEGQGDLVGAKTAYREALDFFRESGDRSQAAVTMGNLASALTQQGELKEARQMYEEALNIKQSVHNRHSVAYTQADLGSLLLSQGDLAGARKMLEDSLATRTELGEKTNAARGRLYLASVTLEEGNPAEALAVAQQLEDVFHSSNLPDDEASAYDVAARCLLALGKRQAAAAEIQKAEDLSAKSADKDLRLGIAITRGRILTASTDFSGARNKLGGALAAATKAGLVLEEFDARLAIGELKMKSEPIAPSRTYLASLEKDATAKGFLLIARKAKAAGAKT